MYRSAMRTSGTVDQISERNLNGERLYGTTYWLLYGYPSSGNDTPDAT